MKKLIIARKDILDMCQQHHVKLVVSLIGDKYIVEVMCEGADVSRTGPSDNENIIPLYTDTH